MKHRIQPSFIDLLSAGGLYANVFEDIKVDEYNKQN